MKSGLEKSRNKQNKLIRTQRTEKFDSELRKFVKKDKKRVRSVIAAVDKFKNNPHHPSLRLEKLKGSDFWTIRIDKGSRIFFVWLNEDVALFCDIGPHDKYRKY